ncbi:prolyl oligopeptidase family serine peptidase [Kineosporia babensis]|uniref:Prolyl oligopeptidase family serine peptidase n=1 Tax=Kineosporia babensis TaxID=499548 RepID=A0A9X1SSW6_9ACTN|nr:PHB depolymerase family esterase [Kineosporia babensis]MCD5311004.1 prolyl oligopeptidase family serine peptidase [Kineosporia babensis]
MTMPVGRRGVLAAGAGAAAGLLIPATAAQAATQTTSHASTQATNRAGSAVKFVLNAEVLDGGEQVTAVTLDLSRHGPIDARGLSTSTFTVHAQATGPIAGVAGGEYDLDRTVTDAHLDRHGNIVLELEHGEGKAGAATLGYLFTRGRNVRMNLRYTITQNEPLRRKRGKPLTIDRFVQGKLISPEVDSFSHHGSEAGLKYRLYKPEVRGKRPLVVWLHGGGEGAVLADGYYDNETQLRANRGALGFVTREAQKIFGGAYVVAPQSTSYWLEDGDRFAPLIRQIIKDVAGRHDIDRDRIYVVGCSNGGYMSLKMTTTYPALFAASVPICGVVVGSPPMIPDADLQRISTPTWLVTSLDDATVDPVANTVHAHQLIPRSKVTLYDEVVWDGYKFPGHWSWIYVGRNDPSIKGQTVWEWMARQRG